MQKILSKFIVYYQLGFTNLILVALYRSRVKFGLFEKVAPIHQCSLNGEHIYLKPVQNFIFNNKIQTPKKLAFGWFELSPSLTSKWLMNIISGEKVKHNKRHWSQIGDFDNEVGDIKTVWELSRFGWLLPLTLQYLKTGEQSSLDKINHWLNDWQKHNPANQGVNWKCGQECSIRVMHLAATCYLLKQDKSITEPVAEFMYQHLTRIAPTISYAVAQDNNHGTSEAAALYIGALLLKTHQQYQADPVLKKWQHVGQSAIENRCKKLIADDGCFSQNSVNYHRLMLDTLSLAEFFRQQFKQASFSQITYQKLQKATQWLAAMVDTETGFTPILGLNDGAQLLPVTTCDYLDYRPSVQWAYHLFLGENFLPPQDSFQQLVKLFPAIEKNTNKSPTTIKLTSDYQYLRNDQWRCYLRTPTAKFRPSQCDALHVDIWHNHTNICISTGSFSYNCEAKWQDYFPSVRAQNTVQFDDKEQMPKLSRFLYRDWITTKIIKHTADSLCANYQNREQHFHHRELNLSSDKLTITDTISGFNEKAILRWHLPTSDWQLTENIIRNQSFQIEITSPDKIGNIALVEGWQSRYYLKKEPITVIEITVDKPTIMTTTLSLTA